MGKQVLFFSWIIIFFCNWEMANGQETKKKVVLIIDTSSKGFEQKLEYPRCVLTVINRSSGDGDRFLDPAFHNEVNFTQAQFNTEATFQFSSFLDDANFSAARFDTGANFNQALFGKDVSFSLARFHGFVFFEGVRFNSGEARFSGACFYDPVSFSTINDQHSGLDINTVFSGSADFGESWFKEYASFFKIQFQGRIDFAKSIIEGRLRFDSSLFENDALFADLACDSLAEMEFAGAVFKEKPIFDGSRLYNVSFNGVRFEKGISCRGDTIYHSLDFSSSDIKKYANLSFLSTPSTSRIVFFRTRLPDLVDFSNNYELQNEVNFADADFDRSQFYSGRNPRYHYINLFKTKLDKVKLDYLHFRFCFYDSKNSIDSFDKKISWEQDTMIYGNKKMYKYDHSVIDFLENNEEFRKYLGKIFPRTGLSDSAVFIFIHNCIEKEFFPRALSEDDINSIYEGVLNNFDKQGLKVSYRLLDIDYKDYKNGKFLIPHIWNCYGYHKEWVFWWTGAFLLLFTLITFFFLPALNNEPQRGGVYYVKNMGGDFHLKSTKNYLRRLWYSFAYTSTIFFLFSLKMENLNFRKGGIIYVLLVYFIGVVCIAYMAGFVLAR